MASNNNKKGPMNEMTWDSQFMSRKVRTTDWRGSYVMEGSLPIEIPHYFLELSINLGI